ncbi:MAG: Hsp70 family protein [bacterium]
MSSVLGIDLGTTNSVAAMVIDGRPVVIPNPFGKRVTPSVVSFTPEDEFLVGEPARNQAAINSGRTVFSIKRRMGSVYKVWMEGKSYLPQEISAVILRKLRRDAESFRKRKITQAVITVPAYFNHAQRQATKEAGTIAGLDVIRIINEPTAAALAYGLHENPQPQTILVYDLGGGTFDVSLLEIGGGVFEVLAASGNNHLGGDDFDRILIEDVRTRFKKRTGVDLMTDPFSRNKLREEMEKAKISLSQLRSVSVSVPFISATREGPVHLEEEFTQVQFEQMIETYVSSTIGPIHRVLNDSGRSLGEIDRVLLVGGSTRIPLVQRMIYEAVGIRPSISINPDEIVAMGAALQGAILEGEIRGSVLIDVTPFTLGIETEGGGFASIIPRNRPIPIERSRIFTAPPKEMGTIEIHVLQGELARADQNVSLGRFHLQEIGCPKEESKIRVTFSIDTDGIVHVRAVNTSTGHRDEVTITDLKALSGNQLEQMTKSADRCELEARQREREIDRLVRTGQDLIRQARALLDSLVKSEKEVMLESIGQLNDALSTCDRAALKNCISDLEFLLEQMAEVTERMP